MLKMLELFIIIYPNDSSRPLQILTTVIYVKEGMSFAPLLNNRFANTPSLEWFRLYQAYEPLSWRGE